MAYAIQSVTDAGDDVLVVAAVDQDGNEVQAQGWVSATTNHYDPSAYDHDGNIVDGAQPRAMTPAEVGEYALSLLPPSAEPEPIKFVAPQTP